MIKATVSSIERASDGHAETARVIPASRPTAVSAPFWISADLRAPGRLAVGDVVACADFGDGTGLVIAHANGGVMPNGSTG